MIMAARRSHDEQLFVGKFSPDDIQGRGKVAVGGDEDRAIKSILAGVKYNASSYVYVGLFLLMLNPLSTTGLARSCLALEVAHHAVHADVLKSLYVFNVPFLRALQPDGIRREVVDLDECLSGTGKPLTQSPEVQPLEVGLWVRPDSWPAGIEFPEVVNGMIQVEAVDVGDSIQRKRPQLALRPVRRAHPSGVTATL